MKKFCDTPFWDLNITWNTEDPDFTPCFQKTVLAWTPCLFLWVMSPMTVYHLYGRNMREISINTHCATKLNLTILLILLSVTDLIFYDENQNLVDLCSPLIKASTFILFLMLTYASRKSGIHSSAILFIFSLLLVICGIPQFRTELRAENDSMSLRKTTEFFSYMIYYPTTVFIFILNCFADSYHNVRRLVDEDTCPEFESSFLSRLLFAWLDPLVWKGFKKSLHFDDIWKLESIFQSFHVVPKFDTHWRYSLDKVKRQGHENSGNFQEAGKKKHASIIPAIYKTFREQFLIGAVIELCAAILTAVSPLVLSLLLDFINGTEPMWRGYLYSSLLCLLPMAGMMCLIHSFHVTVSAATCLRSCLISQIYKKVMRLSNKARRDFSMGEIVNLITVDIQRIHDVFLYLHKLCIYPIQIAFVLVFLWQLLGPSALAGLIMIAILIPINAWISAKIKNLQTVQMINKDNRIKLMNQILSGIKALKLYAWEPSYEKEVLNAREEEIKILKKQAYLSLITTFIQGCAPFLISLVTFAAFVLSNNKNILDARIAFVSLSLFNILETAFKWLPMVTSFLIQAIVSIARINKFLNSEELNSADVSHEDRVEPLVMENASFSWEGKTEIPVLRDINIKVNSGSLVAVVGSVGAGKSSLISAFLGEMYKISGYINTKGTIAYVPQQAWVQNSTLKDNITFQTGAENGDFYEKVIKACALMPDLQILAAGDQTEIGEKGINLSGGQKQRISLARAVYFNADVYFLDDPLSAVDAHVGKHIFENVIGPHGLLKEKTRVLVTHSVTYLPQVDFIIVMQNGSISECGTYHELLNKKGEFAEFLSTHLKDKVAEPLAKRENEFQNVIPTTSQANVTSKIRSSGESVQNNMVGQKLTRDELVETGNVKLSTLVYFLKFVGVAFCLFVLLSSLMFQSFSVGTNLWLAKWAGNPGATHTERNLYLIVYAVLGLSQGIWQSLADLSIRLGIWKCARILHNLLLRNILRVPLSFMDMTPIGRILSRFSKDIDMLDNNCPFNVSNVMKCFGNIICTLLIVSFTTPIFVTTILPLGLLYFLIQRLYIATSRQLKRLNSVSASPIYSHFSESITGAQSIRAYGLQDEFTRQVENKVDFYHGSLHLYWSTDRWLALRLMGITNIITFFAALFSVLEKDKLGAESVGLSVTYALQLTYALNWLIRSISEFETNLVSIERIKEYEEVTQEAPWKNSNENVPDQWPERGDIVFYNFKLRYRKELDFVLKELTLRVNDGEKIGIVGRTGAGKSSLTLGLFRIVESSGGKIEIDGLDISTVGLHTLRSRLTIIPQDAILFSSTLRANLDPECKYSDESIWRALDLVQLKSYVSFLDGGLQYEVSEGGENFSVGQRHLICLARALLRKTKILVLDEATAAIDLETDEIVQATIRNEFKKCTILTIAHRLNTVMDYDRIMVLDKGQIVEFDTPNMLLESKSSVFYAMANDSNLL